MAGTWTSQNKILPGAYINFLASTGISTSTGTRGIVALLQEMSTGTAGAMYTITANDGSEWPGAATTADKFLAEEALKNAETVIVYNLGTAQTADIISAALVALQTVTFNTLCYPYPASTYAAEQGSIATWVATMRDTEGVKIQAVMADFVGNYEGIIDVSQGVILSGSTTLTNAQTTAWVAGATAGASVTQDNTGLQYDGAIDVSPRMTKTQMEAAITAGKWIFKVDTSQNVTAVYDINCLTTYTATKSKVFRKNRVIRTLDGINNDIVTIFESNYAGKISNTADGRSSVRAILIEYFNVMQNMGAIQNFQASDVTVAAGTDSDAVLVTVNVQPVDSIAKIYMTVNLS
jgi:hypothetical protein